MFLNPAHNKPVIKASGAETILLPRDKVESFRRNLAAHDKPLVSWQAYTIKRSDKPETVAAKHGMSLATLKEVNGIVPPKKFVAGQTIMVPVNGSAEPNLPDLPAPKLTPVHAAGKPKPAGASHGRRKGKEHERCRREEARGSRHRRLGEPREAHHPQQEDRGDQLPEERAQMTVV